MAAKIVLQFNNYHSQFNNNCKIFLEGSFLYNSTVNPGLILLLIPCKVGFEELRLLAPDWVRRARILCLWIFSIWNQLWFIVLILIFIFQALIPHGGSKPYQYYLLFYSHLFLKKACSNISLIFCIHPFLWLTNPPPLLVFCFS